nr:MAG TPA: transposase-binding protein [Caudoviricetes sp.]
MPVDEKEVFEICNQVDSFIAEYLTESIVIGTSYDMLEAHHGILPISRRTFYRRKEMAQMLIQQGSARIEEENSGQLRIVW